MKHYIIFCVVLLSRANGVVHLDLQQGVVSGSSPYITILSGPTTGKNSRTCDGQALVRVDFRGTRKPVRFTFHYGDAPKGWTFVISDCPNDYGFGGNFNYSSNCGSTQMINSQLRIYSNQLPGYFKETVDGNALIKVHP